ncbi:NAD(P)-binding domain-containing protein [Frankia sp. Cpl3]|nr:NAD(P)-binding domain-containing protein [Frankia sp. Cpl3]
MKGGFIGLGAMGLPMVQRIMTEGHDLTVWARRPGSLEPFAGTDVTLAASPAEMGAEVDAVGVCVFDAAGVEEVLFGPAGLVEGLRPGAVVLVHATVSPDQVRKIAERAVGHGLRVLDAPVSGGGQRALDGKLTIMVGGDSDTLADVTELLSALSDHIVYLGGIGAGSKAKLINNTLLSAQIALAEDAMRAGQSLGVDPAGLAATLMTSSSACLGSSIRLRSGSMRAMADSGNYVTLFKDVALTADLLDDAPGSELVDVAQRFVTAVQGG